MGILEDAIREHLELKRRRGADPSEVARLEQEALSPAVREPAPPAGDSGEEEPTRLHAPEEAPAPERAAPFDHGADEAADDAAARRPAPEEREPFEPDEAVFEPDEPRAASEPPPPELDLAPSPPDADDGPDEESEDEGAPPEGTARVEQPTVGIDADDLWADDDADEVPADERLDPEDRGAPSSAPADVSEPEPESEPAMPEPPPPPPPPGGRKDRGDVLEETPDFLQDTPDHDRLWFEQKPPRDFDFDD